MISQPLLLSLLITTTSTSVVATDTTSSNLRGSSNDKVSLPWEQELPAEYSDSSQDTSNIIPELATSRRRLDDGAWSSVQSNSGYTPSPSTSAVPTPTPPIAKTKRNGETLYISQECVTKLEATAGDNGRLGPEGYFLFNEALSNSYYASINVTEYSELPYTNKFAFVTLSCQCSAFGGASNCCQMQRANINVQGIDEPSETWSDEFTQYIADICSTTLDAIGEENILPPSGEGSWTQKPTGSPTMSANPTQSNVPSMEPTASSAPSLSALPSFSPTSSTAPSDSPTVSSAPSVSSKFICNDVFVLCNLWVSWVSFRDT